mmetsp:Transcript_6748/g.8738  ORF Transcript_6748/g.8738 Transcript_6748/m.8738 type:complete len:125 (-) Transcript_6748:186-560(-)
MSDQNEIGWEKPAWAKSAGLKKTSRGDAVKGGGNLASPITDLPHQSKDGNFAKPGWTGSAAEKPKPQTDLAMPITTIRDSGDEKLAFVKPEWTKTAGLKESEKGSSIKSGGEIARPIGGIKRVD